MGPLIALVSLLLSIFSGPVVTLQVEPDPTAKCEQPRIVVVRPGITPPNATYQSNSMPPERFRGDRRLTVTFTAPENITRLCNGGRPICGYRIMACQRGNELILPNPCGYGMESYGRLTCHELAHSNGWPPYHGD